MSSTRTPKSLLLFLFIFFVGLPPSHADSRHVRTVDNPDLLTFGAVEMEITETMSNSQIVLMGGTGGVVGEAAVTRPTPGSLRVDFTDIDGARFGLIWFEERGKIVLISPGGRVGTSYFDLQGKRWLPDARFLEMQAENETTFVTMAAIGAVINETRANPVSQKRLGVPTCATGQVETLTKNLGTGVTCSWTPTARGFATALSRSYCCFEAESDANHQCTNTWCYGCCDLLACDATCGLGDYGCFCGMSGFECVGPRFE